MFKNLTSNRLSALTQDQVPEFIRNNYPLFVAFLEAYYEYLEQNGKLLYVSQNLPNYLDIDYVVENNLTDFIELFRRDYMANIPTSVLTDKAKLLKHIKTFYSSKGASKSFKFFFRTLFNEDVETFNTGSQILRVSDGKWYQPTVVRIVPLSNAEGDIGGRLSQTFTLGISGLSVDFSSSNLPSSSDWVALQIFGQTSFASAVVESAAITSLINFSYQELTISNLTKEFLPGEIVSANTGTHTIFGAVLGIVPGIEIVYPGSSYNVGDPVLITGGGGANANAIVSTISSGALSDLGIAMPGTGYQIYPNWLINIGGSTRGANAVIFTVDTSGTRSPNSFPIMDDVIQPSLALPLNGLFSNFSVPNITIRSKISDASKFVTYSNCGPIQLAHVTSGGGGFDGAPVISINQSTLIGNANISIVSLGAIGAFTILDPGLNYRINDDIIVLSTNSRGVSGAGRVTSVNANGAITGTIVDLPSISGYANVVSGSNNVIGKNTLFTTQLLANNAANSNGSGTYIVINHELKRVMNVVNNISLTVDTNFGATATNNVIRLSGYMLGGYGYLPIDFPSGVIVNVRSFTGSGASLTPEGILGEDAVLTIVGGVFGQVEAIQMISFGDHYTSQPSVDLSQSGDGNAVLRAQFVSGQFKYPGYYLNEDGLLSARRYLEDAATYNNYSYQIKSTALVTAYYDLVYNLLNPVGSNIIGITRFNISTGQQDIGSSTSVYANTSLSGNILDSTFILDISHEA